MSKHGQEYNELTPAPGVEEVVAVRVERYGMAYKGILPDDAIERSKAHWRNELLDFADVLLTTHQQEKEALVREILAEERILYSSPLLPKVIAGVKAHDIRAIAARHGIVL